MKAWKATLGGVLVLGLGLVFIPSAPAEEEPEHDMLILQAEDLEWRDGPPSLPPGARFVVLEGDPSAEDYFAIRVEVPPGYRIPPHHHPSYERITVLRGEFCVGMGESFEREEATCIHPGGFLSLPPGHVHFVHVGDEGALVQQNSIGPFDTIYVDPADDPRRAAR